MSEPTTNAASSTTATPDAANSYSASAVALTIAGSDPSGGAGLQADLKVFQQLGVFGMSVITLVTVQNTRGVHRVHVLPSDLVLEQLDQVLSDIRPRAIKTGALGSVELVIAVAERLRKAALPVVVDPVLVSKHGHLLAGSEVIEAYRKHLMPLAWIVTPNRFEAERLTGQSLSDEASAEQALHILQELGVPNVLVKLGDVNGVARHWLATREGIEVIDRPRLQANNTHGTGCILSACLTAHCARGEMELRSSVELAIDQTLDSIRNDSALGGGIHPAETRAIQMPNR